ncbi:terpene synthase [Streptomyces abyssalis]|uniref:Terpene synthase n=1 Tax=Streptomyces abyssalis TaxID=933944 RepID=A0A1E7JQG8_9ACTN|nr:selina-4(15),7(11)-diene synthase [Streptomyces abyssalis]OEU90463.1 terpene synthase [Streptomyces abyssalis]OEU95200.1 terpene synthase [Streptomyces abyssalis]OEV30356.1 terpene synthase [Streptomyces nanshensis]
MEHGLIVPPLFSPIPPAIHPRHEAINERTTAWANAFSIGSPELREKLVVHDIGTFAARVLPEGREEVVSILADFIIWLFGVDDGLCEEGELGKDPAGLVGELSRMLRVAQNPDVPMLSQNALAEGLRDLRHRVSRHATPGQEARWVDALREYFLSVVWEASHRSNETVPDLNDYTLMRLYDGATSVVLPLLEMGHGYELHPNERDSTAVRAAAEMAYFIITWDNDLFSYHKESRAQRYYLNVLRVLEHEQQLSPAQALTRAVAQRDRVMCLFLRLRDELAARGSPQLRQYLENLGTFIRGAQDWGISSHRYTTPHDPAGLPSTFCDTPTDASDEALDIPAVAWWWDVLPERESFQPAFGEFRPSATV